MASAAGKRCRCPTCGTTASIPLGETSSDDAATVELTQAEEDPEYDSKVIAATIHDAVLDAIDDDDGFRIPPAERKPAELPPLPGGSPMVECPACGGMIRESADRCRHCDREFGKRSRKRERRPLTREEKDELLVQPTRRTLGDGQVLGISQGWLGRRIFKGVFKLAMLLFLALIALLYRLFN